jgi:hypothetical protein
VPRDPANHDDQLLAELALLLPAGRAEQGVLDEVALQRLQRGQLSPGDRDELLAQLAADDDAREAWNERARPAGDPELVDRVVDSVLAQRLAEGLPAPAQRRPALRTAGWAALAAGVVLALVLGIRMLSSSGVTPPSYQAGFSGQLQTLRGDPVEPDGMPVYAAASTLDVSLVPQQTPAGPVTLTVAAVSPDGEALLPTTLLIEQRNGVFRVQGPAGSLFGDRAGDWRLVFVFSPEGHEPDEGWLLPRAEELGADGPTSWPGDRQVLVRSVRHEP